MATFLSFNITKPMGMAIMLVFLMILMMEPSTSELNIIPTCRTDRRSPTVADARKCVEHVRNKTRCCRVQQPPPQPAANCTALAKAGTAEALLCGRRPGSCVSCTTAASALQAVANTCGRNVNGTRRTSGSEELEGFTFLIRSHSRPGPGPTASIGDIDELVDDESELSGEPTDAGALSDNSELVEVEAEELGDEDLPPLVSII